MKTFVLGLTLAAFGALFTVPAGAAGGGGWPPMVGPTNPYPSYCQYCGLLQPAPPVIVRYRKPPRHQTNAK